MICLDTNYLIMGLVAGSREAVELLDWAESGETFCVSSVVWYEFLCGPVTQEQKAAMELLIGEIIGFDETIAEESARLFNEAGRKRSLRVDAIIAATALTMNAPLATRNIADFASFQGAGLQIVGGA